MTADEKPARNATDTPMMRQYLEIKARYPGAFLFYRMGDFYELFLEDAERASALLDITLTTRDRKRKDAIPMCGVPVHSADGYIKRLAGLGHRVAICEQVEDAKSAGARKLVRRDVIEVITPGLVGDPETLPATGEVALLAVWRDTPGAKTGAPAPTDVMDEAGARLSANKRAPMPTDAKLRATAPTTPARAAGEGGAGSVGIAALDVSTGNFRATQVSLAGVAENAWPSALLDEVARIAPRELLVSQTLVESAAFSKLAGQAESAARTIVPAEHFEPAKAPATPHGFNAAHTDAATRAAAAVLAYLATQQPAALQNAPRLRRYDLGDAMILDAATRRHLELFENSENRSRKGTLIERVDETAGALGARRLARWMAYPLCAPDAIRARQDAVAWLAERDRPRARLRAALKQVRDLERIYARCARPGAQPRDLAALRASLAALPEVSAALAANDASAPPFANTQRPPALPEVKPVPGAAALLTAALVDEPAPLPKGSRGANASGFVREGFSEELDALHESARRGRAWIAELEARERDATGITNLKVRFHPVHGYALEVPKAQLTRVPEYFERKQTLANVERFSTLQLREVAARVMGAGERAAALEREILENVRQRVLAEAEAMRAAADACAELDALQSLAEVARRGGWQRPVVDASRGIEIRGGRHPVVEAMRAAASAEEFVPNDTELDAAAKDGARILLITGPNMAGKSTYLRQVAVLVLLAQIGSFLPAEAARIGVVDRVFTRVGASDRLAQGESTFMVEMRETAEILSQASARSLVILDEIGRGTSTFDGLSIAWAVGEYLHDTAGLGPRTLFATHYHELADLARTRAGVRNAHFDAREIGEDVVFLRRLLPGEASRSYGIQVARLAGLPEPVIARARAILRELESGERASGASGQLPLFEKQNAAPAKTQAAARAQEWWKTLRELDAERLTPLAALTLLSEWSARAKEPGDGEGGGAA